jgi:chromosome segregation ATPase
MEAPAVPMKRVRKNPYEGLTSEQIAEKKAAFVARMKEGKMRAKERRLAAAASEPRDNITELAEAQRNYRTLRAEQDALVAEINGADDNFTRINLQISELEVRRAALRHRMRELDNQEARLATSMVALEDYIYELEDAIAAEARDRVREMERVAAAGGGEP